MNKTNENGIRDERYENTRDVGQVRRPNVLLLHLERGRPAWEVTVVDPRPLVADCVPNEIKTRIDEKKADEHSLQPEFPAPAWLVRRGVPSIWDEGRECEEEHAEMETWGGGSKRQRTWWIGYID
jgi:hypothetical protein